MRQTLVYDADCGFCTRSARWLEDAGRGVLEALPWQTLDLDALGLTTQQVTEAAYWVEGDRPIAAGADAIAAALCATRWRLIGRVILCPPVQPIAKVVYRLVARNRHRMPGGTASCRMDKQR